MQKILVKVHNNNAVIEQLTVDIRNDGVKKLQAGQEVNYELIDEKTGRAPQHLITKRINEDLHLSFENKGEQTNLIIEGFYGSSEQALIGFAEDGNYYYYIPDTGEAVDYVTQLVTGDVEGQALGGPAQISPWWTGGSHQGGEVIWPWLVGLGVLGAAGYVLAEDYMSSKDEELAKNNRADAPTVRFDTLDGTDDSERVVTIEPGGDNVNLTISYTDTFNNPQTIRVIKSGDGVWSSAETLPTGVMLDASTGAVTIADEGIDDVSQLVAIGKDSSNNTATAQELIADAESDPATTAAMNLGLQQNDNGETADSENMTASQEQVYQTVDDSYYADEMTANTVLTTQFFSETVCLFDATKQTDQASEVSLFIPEMMSATFADGDGSRENSSDSANGVVIEATMNDYMDDTVFLNEGGEQISVVVPISVPTPMSPTLVNDTLKIGVIDDNLDDEIMDFYVTTDAVNTSILNPNNHFVDGDENLSNLNDVLTTECHDNDNDDVVISDLFITHDLLTHDLTHDHVDSIETEASVVVSMADHIQLTNDELALHHVDANVGANEHSFIGLVTPISDGSSIHTDDDIIQLDVTIPII